MKVCVANPSLHPKSLYLPYLWARLKTYIDLDFDKKVNVEWVNPIYTHDVNLDSCNFDLLALSCYTWNWDTNLKLAAQAKKYNPKCIVVAGGPHVDYKNPNIFNIHKNIDIICYTEGEKVFAELLFALQNNLDIDNIPGIITRNNSTKILTTVSKLDLSVLSSPWIHCKDELKKHSNIIKKMGCRVNVPFETNRGCPYSCSFCDWGSATNSKVKKFNTETILKEIEIIMDMCPDFVFITDANYGIYKEDYDFIKKFIECKEKNNHQTYLYFSAAKNKKTVLAQCYAALHKAKMINVAQLGIQHTDLEVLKIIDRDNIKMEESLYQMEESWQYGVPLVPGLILGNPGDTVKKWKKCLADMLRMNFHEELRIFDFQLLPNAPAMEKDYYQKYKLGQVTKLYAEMPKDRNMIKTDFLVESFSYTKQDWIEMQVLSYIYQAGHVASIFKFLAIFAYNEFDISYEDFYDHVINLPTIKEILIPVYKLLNKYIFGSKQNKFIEYDGYTMNVENYIYLKCIKNLNQIYKEMSIDFKEYKESLFEFQKFIVLNFEDKRDILDLEYNYKEYFLDVLSLPAFQKTNKKPIKTKTTYKKNYKLGFYQQIDAKQITSLHTLNDKIFSVSSNWRHKLFYHSGVLEY
jgi:putative methyltransferase